MKVAAVLPEIEPMAPLKGGAGTLWFKNVLPLLSMEEITVLSPPDEEQYSGFRIKNMKLYSYVKPCEKLLPQSWHKYLELFYPLQVAVYSRINRFNCFLVFNRPLYCILIRFFNRRSKIVLRMGNDHLIQLPRWFGERVVAGTDKIICCSNYVLKGIVKQYPHAEEKALVIYNGVDPEQFLPRWLRNVEREKENPYGREDHKRVLYVGRLNESKGIHCLIEAMKKVMAVIPEARLVVVGSSWFGREEVTDYMQKLVEISAEIEDKISFSGHIAHAELSGYYAYADLFVLPAIWQEPMPNVVLEAMASGVPVVASKRGGIPEAVDSFGILVDPENRDELAQAIIEMLSSSQKALKMAEDARKRVETLFSWEKCADEVGKVLCN